MPTALITSLIPQQNFESVRKPQYATLEAVCRGLGYTLEPMRRLGVSKPVDMSDGTVVKLKPKK